MNLDGWMALRWLDVINEMPELRKIVRRGKVLARKKAIDRLEVAQGLVTAECEDDGGAIYSVRIRQAPLVSDVWDEVLDELAADASHSASLLAGRITEGCAEVFDLAGVDLFPFDVRDMTTFCTCADEGVLCRHAAATHVALAHAIELDPFLLFVFRGMPQADLLTKLRKRRGVSGVGDAAGADGQDLSGAAGSAAAASSMEPADAVLVGFWERGVVPHLAFRLGTDSEEHGGEPELPIVRALGAGPGGIDADEVVTVLAPVVKMAHKRVADIVEQASTADAPSEDLAAADTDNLGEILVAAAHQHGGLTSTFVAEAMSVSKTEARKYLQWLVEEGRLKISGKARSTKYVPV